MYKLHLSKVINVVSIHINEFTNEDCYPFSYTFIKNNETTVSFGLSLPNKKSRTEFIAEYR